MSSQSTFESMHKAFYEKLINQIINCVVDYANITPEPLTANKLREILKMPVVTSVMPPILNGATATSNKKRSKCNGPPCQYIPGRGNKKGLQCGQKSPDNIPVCRSHRTTKGGKEIAAKYNSGSLVMQSPALPNVAPIGIKQAPQIEKAVDYELDVEEGVDGAYLAKTEASMPHRFVIVVKGEGDYETEKVRITKGDPSTDRKLNPLEVLFAQNLGLNVVNAIVPTETMNVAQSSVVNPGVPNLEAFPIPALPQLASPNGDLP